MSEAGAEILDCMRALEAAGDTVVSEILREQGSFREWDHYPEGDAYDRDSHAQYYYHAHAKEERPDEQGHFHTFLRPQGMPSGVSPVVLEGDDPPPGGNDALSHLIAISIDPKGHTIGLFTTNRWVTGESWYVAEDVIPMLDRFRVDRTEAPHHVNRWITATLRLFRPQIVDLLRQRDTTVASWRMEHPRDNVFEDRRLEITSQILISVPDHIRRINAALKAAR